MPPIFLQTMFRSGGTWLWSRFRAEAGLRCYYEPLHSILLGLKASAGADRRSTTALRHPDLKAGYFEEVPLLASGGVPFHKPQFSWKRMVLEADDDHPELERYLRFLIDFAAWRNQRPVMKFVRASLRAAWLRQRFSPLQIYLCRHPSALMRSYLSFPSNFFVEPVLGVMLEEREHPWLHTACARLIPPEILSRLPTDESRKWFGKLDHLLPMLPKSTLFEVIVVLWLASLAAAATASDLVIDYDRLTAEDAYRSRMEATLRELTGIPVRLDELAPPPPAPPWPRLDPAAMARLREIAKAPQFSAAAQLGGQLHPAAREVVESLLF